MKEKNKMDLRKPRSLLIIFMMLFIAAPLLAVEKKTGQPNESNVGTVNDNTRINERDRKKSAVTANQQGQRDSDIAITQKIRQALMDRNDLSTYAQNVKVIAVNGIVTLKGPVRSSQEKRTVEQLARSVVGADKVKNEMDVASSE